VLGVGGGAGGWRWPKNGREATKKGWAAATPVVSCDGGREVESFYLVFVYVE